MNDIKMERHESGGKPVYTFESHNIALAAWAEIRRDCPEDLILISLDHHTDTVMAFRKSDFVHGDGRIDEDGIEPRIRERISQIDWRDSSSVAQAVAELRHDEQIDAAIRLGLFSFAFCLNRSDETRPVEVTRHYEGADWTTHRGDPPRPPYTYEVPENRIFEIREICAIGCGKMPHDDNCLKPAADQAIESVMLDCLLSKANQMAHSAGIDNILSVPYVLDIDLDYFRTEDSLTPQDPAVFYSLIKGAVGFTIATEPEYVVSGRVDDKLTSEFALEQVRHHIRLVLEGEI